VTAEPVDLEKARLFLGDYFGEAVSDVSLVGEGAWSKAFGFLRDDRNFIIRFGKYAEDFEKDRYAATFTSTYLPIPKVLDVGSAYGGAFAISERHAGLFLERLDAESTVRLTPNLLRLFDALRDVPIDQDGSSEWPTNPARHLSWEEWLCTSVEDDDNPRVGGWRGDLAKDAEIEELYVRGVKALNSRVKDCPRALHLVHGDLLNRNVLVSTDAQRIEAVFDWGRSVYGDYLYDVAWFTFWGPWHEGLRALDFRTVFREHTSDVGLDVSDYEERLACYELQIGLTHLAYNTVINDLVERDRVARRIDVVLASGQ